MGKHTRRPHSTTPEEKAAYAAREGTGYCRTPEHGKFREGDGRHRAGRPKGEQNFETIAERVLNAPVTLTEANKPPRIGTTQEAFMLGVLRDAISPKDPRKQEPARRMLFSIINELDRRKRAAAGLPDAEAVSDAEMDLLLEHLVAKRAQETGGDDE